MSEIHAYEARKAFAENICQGEAAIDIPRAALQIVAEDDAIMTHSTVPFPVQSYLDRAQRLAEVSSSSGHHKCRFQCSTRQRREQSSVCSIGQSIYVLQAIADDSATSPAPLLPGLQSSLLQDPPPFSSSPSEAQQSSSLISSNKAISCFHASSLFFSCHRSGCVQQPVGCAAARCNRPAAPPNGHGLPFPAVQV